MKTYTILGAGLSGLSLADHLQQQNISFRLFEGKSHGGGHIYSEKVNGFVWDEGPHVSFTKHQYVKDYFAANCSQAYLEYPTNPSNYFQGSWIPHPAQAHMYAVPSDLRERCIRDVVAARDEQHGTLQAANYGEWIEHAFGKSFANCFPKVYTNKYWTTDPVNLTTDWIGKRIYFPEISDMVQSANGPLNKQTHYIDKVRYPEWGGYYSYIEGVEKRIPISYEHQLRYISFEKNELEFENGHKEKYENLISTIPLPALIANSDAPTAVKLAAEELKCSQVLIVNVVANHPAVVDNHWIYVYDQDFYATRINFTELLSPNNGEAGKTGIQVEVYFSAYRALEEPIPVVEQKVIAELLQMGLLLTADHLDSVHSKWINWANVIFDNKRVEAQDTVFNWLSSKGLHRESGDLEPMTDWENKPFWQPGSIILAGRFAQWKYYWTDDCVMRAVDIVNHLAQQS